VINLVLAKKLWEEKGKVIGMSVKSVGPEGVCIEETFTSEVKGLGRFPSGRNIGTMNIVARPDGLVSGPTQGIFTAQNGDTVVWKCLGIGKQEAGKNKNIAVIQPLTTSKKLSWMNSFLIVYESIGDTKTMEFTGTAYEWK
jgi:hypothetical protein